MRCDALRASHLHLPVIEPTNNSILDPVALETFTVFHLPGCIVFFDKVQPLFHRPTGLQRGNYALERKREREKYIQTLCSDYTNFLLSPTVVEINKRIVPFDSKLRDYCIAESGIFYSRYNFRERERENLLQNQEFRLLSVRCHLCRNLIATYNDVISCNCTIVKHNRYLCCNVIAIYNRVIIVTTLFQYYA